MIKLHLKESLLKKLMAVKQALAKVQAAFVFIYGFKGKVYYLICMLNLIK